MAQLCPVQSKQNEVHKVADVHENDLLLLDLNQDQNIGDAAPSCSTTCAPEEGPSESEISTTPPSPTADTAASQSGDVDVATSTASSSEQSFSESNSFAAPSSPTADNAASCGEDQASGDAVAFTSTDCALEQNLLKSETCEAPSSPTADEAASCGEDQDSCDVVVPTGTDCALEQNLAESETFAASSSPNAQRCCIMSLPFQEGLACFLSPAGLSCLSLCCSTLQSELTCEVGGDGDAESRRVLLMPVVDIHMEVADALLHKISLPHVRTLRIWSRLSFNLVVDAVRSGYQLCALERLSLKGCGLHPQDVKEMLMPVLAASKCIKLLSLEKNRITCDTLKALGASEFLSRVESLNVRFNNIGNDGAKAIAASPWAKSLQVLNLKQNRVTDDGAVALASMLRDSQCLRLLNLRRQTPPLTDKAAFAFAESMRQNASALQQLRLRRNRITDAGAVALAAAAGERMTRLCRGLSPWDLRLELDLEENRVGNKGALALLAMAAKCPKCIRLEILLSSNQASRDSLCSAVTDAGEHLDAMDSRVKFETKPEGAL